MCPSAARSRDEDRPALLLQGEALHRFAFEHRGIIADLIKHCRGENKKSPLIHPPSPFGFSWKEEMAVPSNAEAAESSWRLDRRHCHISAVSSVEGDGRRYVDVAYTIPVRHAKRILTLEIMGYSSEPSSRTRIIPCIDQSYAPWLCHTLMNLHSILFHIESDVRHVQEIIREILLDEVSLISATNDELVDSVLRVHFEDVPQDRSTADLDHRFWSYDCLFAKPGPEPTRQYHCLHSHL